MGNITLADIEAQGPPSVLDGYLRFQRAPRCSTVARPHRPRTCAAQQPPMNTTPHLAAAASCHAPHDPIAACAPKFNR